MSAAEQVIVSREGAVARVTLNRPERLNALTDAMRECISAAFAELGRDDSVRVVIIDEVVRGLFE